MLIKWTIFGRGAHRWCDTRNRPFFDTKDEALKFCGEVIREDTGHTALFMSPRESKMSVLDLWEEARDLIVEVEMTGNGEFIVKEAVCG